MVALIIGAGGGYAGARFFSSASGSDIAARDKTIADLSQALRKTKTDVQGASTQQTVLQGHVKDLEAEVNSLQRTRDSLRKRIDQQAAANGSDAQAEIAALKKTIEEAGDLSGKLNRAQKSLKVSELQIIELEKTTSDQTAEIAKLKQAADQADGHVNPVIAVLQAQKQTLETQLADAKSEAGDVPALKSRISALEDQLTKQAKDADVEAAQQIAALQEQRDALQARLAAALKSAGDAGQQTKKIADLQKQLDEMAESLAGRDQAARDAGKGLNQAKADLEKSRQQVKTLKAQNAALGAAQADLARQVASLNATIAKLKAATPPLEDKPVVTNNSQDNGDQGELTPRDRANVEKAVADLPGYDNLSSDKQEALIGMLEKGECVTDSLKAAYGHVSPISLSRLFRDLGGHC